MAKLTVDLVDEPSGETYTRLLDWCSARSDRIVLVRRSKTPLTPRAESLLRDLESYCTSVESNAWPGTTLLGDTATVLTYETTSPVLAALESSCDRLYGWTHPELPEDLSFVRADGTPLLVTIAHERDGYLELTREEYDLLMRTLAELRTVVRSRWPHVPFNWPNALALVALDTLRVDQIADVAALAVEHGFDASVLRQLAGLDDGAPAPRHDALVAALQAAGAPLPSIATAAERLTRAVSHRIVARQIDPMTGTAWLASLSGKTFGHTKIFDPFIYADSEFEDRPDERALFERMVMGAANVILFGPDATLAPGVRQDDGV
jgi:hypothetical protein